MQITSSALVVETLLLVALQTSLSPGTPLERKLGAGETHTYQVVLKAGDYIDILMEQRGIDVAAKMFGPAGGELREFDSPTGALGPEHARMIASVDGTYRLDVRALQPEADPGAYQIRLALLRPATEADRRVDAAVSAAADADRLRASAETREQSVERYKYARALWQTAGDRAGEASALRALGFAYVRLKRDPAAAETITEAQRIFRELGDKRADAYIHLILAKIHTRRAYLRAALESTERALPLWRAAKDAEQEAFTLAALGTTHARLGDAREMKRLHTEAVRVARATRRPALIAAMLQSEGGAAEILSDLKGARAAYESALQFWRQAGNKRGEAAATARIEALAGKTPSRLVH